MSSIAWDKNVAWFDVAEAASIFVLECADYVELISIEVARPENRTIEAFCKVRLKPIYFSVAMCCGGPSAVKRVAAIMGRKAKIMADRSA